MVVLMRPYGNGQHAVYINGRSYAIGLIKDIAPIYQRLKARE